MRAGRGLPGGPRDQGLLAQARRRSVRRAADEDQDRARLLLEEPVQPGSYPLMGVLRVIEFLSLDGVMQAPGAADEDTEGGFRHGGWQRPYFDDVLGATAAEGMAETDAYLFGRKTYEKMAAFWPTAPEDDPYGRHMNSTPKYVASRTLQDVEWRNSTLIEGDVAQEGARLKEQPGKNIAVLVSGDLRQAPREHDLVDEFFLAVYPLVLGRGKRLFRDSAQVRKLHLVDSKPTSTGGGVLPSPPAYPRCRSAREPRQPPLQEPPLGVRVNELERPVVGGAGLFDPIEPAQQLRAGRVEVVVALELEALDQVEGGFGVARLGHRSSLIELDN